MTPKKLAEYWVTIAALTDQTCLVEAAVHRRGVLVFAAENLSALSQRASRKTGGGHMKAPDWISRENIEWAARLYRYLRGRPLTRYGSILVLGALTLYSNILQLIVAGIFLLLEKQLTIPDAPQGVF